ncbi:MAG: hypothetical protein DYG89_28950 [Caldilinea sp. CFX5]|nr:hypothetical protein [Caldilinea sp. CFX5]
MLQAYQKRWQSVAEVEVKEQQQMSPALRWQKLNSLLRMAVGLGLLHRNSDTQIEIVRQRWNRLRSLYLSNHQEKQP